MEYSFINYLWFFISYAFLGWCVEVIFQAVNKGEFINRGFLNGPICPIYGFGMVTLLYILEPLVDNVLFLFLGSVLLTSLLEYLTGFILEKVFNDKWWDYSEKPFNIKGYISLSFSIVWGLAAVFVIQIVHPFIIKLTSVVTNKIGNYLLALLFLYFAADFIVTIVGILKINKRLRLLEAMSKKLHIYSEGVGIGIYKGVTKTMEFTEKVHDKIEDSKSDIEAALEKNLDKNLLKEKYNKLIKEKHFVQKRLEKAYPNIKKKINKHKKRS